KAHESAPRNPAMQAASILACSAGTLVTPRIRQSAVMPLLRLVPDHLDVRPHRPQARNVDAALLQEPIQQLPGFDEAIDRSSSALGVLDGFHQLAGKIRVRLQVAYGV